jgi:hypothetical protein
MNRNTDHDWKEIRKYREEEAETIRERMNGYISYEVAIRRLLAIQKWIDKLMGGENA